MTGLGGRGRRRIKRDFTHSKWGNLLFHYWPALTISCSFFCLFEPVEGVAAEAGLPRLD